MVAAAVLPESNDGPAIDYWPRGASRDLFRHHEPEVVLSGPAGTGKTYGTLWRLHLAALKYPGIRVLLVRKTLESLTASALVTYQARVLGAGRWGVQAFGGSKLRPAGFRYPNGSEVLVGGLDKPEKVMSQEYDIIFPNEATDLAEDEWEALTTRARHGAMPWQQVIGDCNPQSPGHWLYRRCHVAKKCTMLESVHQDNPVLWDGHDWTEQGRAYLATLSNLTGHRRDRLLRGLWVNAEGAVYPAFNRQTHVKAVDCDGWGTILALDVGTRNPTALGVIRHAGDRIHVEAEFYAAGLGSDEIVGETERRYWDSRAACVVYDPSAVAIATTLERRGVRCRKANNDVAEGIRRVTSVLLDLTIDPSCVKTIEEHEGYHYPPNATKDAPVKVDDHTCDMLRYAVMALTAPMPKAVAAAGVPQRSAWIRTERR